VTFLGSISVSNQYYVRRGSKISGPAKAELLERYAANGKLRATDQVSTSQNGPWHTVSQVPSLASHLPGAPKLEATVDVTPGNAGQTLGGSSTDRVESPFGLAMQFFMFGMWSVMYAYTPELYPTHVRATGTGFASSIGRIGAFLGPTLVGVILPRTGQPGVFILAGCSFLIAAVRIIVLGKETKRIVLEEI